MKRNIRIIIIAAVAVIVGVMCVLYGSRARYTADCSLYFLNSSQTSLSLEERKIVCREESELPAAVLKALIKGPESTQNKRVINRGAKLLGIETDADGNMSVNFSSEFLSGNRTLFSVYAVVKSLCSISSVKSAKVLVDGEDILDSDGEPIGNLTAEDINLEIDTDTSDAREIKLYFADGKAKKLTEEIRNVRITDQQPVEQYIINELIKGPENNSYQPVLSSDTTLISVDIANNIGFVNFGKNFIEKNSGSDKQAEFAIFAIVNSMTELESINRVQFLVEGKKAERLGDIDISHPIGRNNDIIE